MTAFPFAPTPRAATHALLLLCLTAGAGTAAHAQQAPDTTAVPQQPARLKSEDCPKPVVAEPALYDHAPDQRSAAFELLVGADGAVRDIKLRTSTGYRDLDRAAMRAFGQCPFEPGRTDGVAQASWLKVSYTFPSRAEQLARAATMPVAVARMAQAYAASAPEYPLFNQRPAAVTEYARAFFAGFTHPAGGSDAQSAATRSGHAAGRAYRRDHPDQLDAILAGYGYTRVDTEGAWSRGFEQSDFVPQGREPDKWWVGALGDVGWTALRPGQADANFRHARVRIEGYLSRPGKYGHMGAYERELLATGFTVIGAANP